MCGSYGQKKTYENMIRWYVFKASLKFLKQLTIEGVEEHGSPLNKIMKSSTRSKYSFYFLHCKPPHFIFSWVSRVLWRHRQFQKHEIMHYFEILHLHNIICCTFTEVKLWSLLLCMFFLPPYHTKISYCAQKSLLEHTKL